MFIKKKKKNQYKNTTRININILILYRSKYK